MNLHWRVDLVAHVSLDSGFFVHVQEVLHSRKISINNSDSLVETTSCNKQMTICIIIPHVMYVVPELLLHNIYIKYNDYNMYIYIYIIVGWHFRCLNTSFRQPCETQRPKTGARVQTSCSEKGIDLSKKAWTLDWKFMKFHYHSNAPPGKKGSPKGQTSKINKNHSNHKT